MNRIVCFDTGNDDDNEGQVKITIEHPLMKTVYAIGYDAHKRRFDLKKNPFKEYFFFQ